MRGRRNPERIRWGEQSPGGEGEGHLVVMPSRAPSSGEKTAYKAAQQLERQMLNDRRRGEAGAGGGRAGGGESDTAAARSG